VRTTHRRARQHDEPTLERRALKFLKIVLVQAALAMVVMLAIAALTR